MKSAQNKRRQIHGAAKVVVESLEQRTLLSVTLTPTNFSVPTTTGATVIPWLQTHSGSTPVPDPSDEELMGFAKSPVPGSQVEAMVVKVNDWGAVDYDKQLDSK